jgi:hypothetical protein
MHLEQRAALSAHNNLNFFLLLEFQTTRMVLMAHTFC